jgi:hypothetical protein
MNITPGTLCLVTKGYHTGQSVIAERFVHAGDSLPSGGHAGHDYWLCTGRDLKVRNKVTGELVDRNYSLFTSARLLPIPPLADPITTKQEEKKPCTA